MTGWRWCKGARGCCFDCGQVCRGVWKYWLTEATSTMSVCAECAGKEG